MNKERNKALLIGIAAMLHDVGKIFQRSGTALMEEYKRDKVLYSEILGSKNSHFHAAHSASFMERWFGQYPTVREMWKEHFPGTDIVITSASHHNPSSGNIPALIIQRADWIASGLDRDEYEKREEDRDYKKVKLSSVPNQVFLYKNPGSDVKYTHDIVTFSEKSIFPKKYDNSPTDDGYRTCKDELDKGFKLLLEKLYKENDLYQFTFALDTLLLRTSMYVPASTQYNYDEVSLYDHCKTTAAFAVALWQYHNKYPKTERNDNSAEKFLIVRGEFFGIQSFIFNKEQSHENPSKILRGKSFYVSLLVEAATLIFIEELSITPFNVMFNAAGSFVVIAGNTEEIRKKVDDIEEKINKWLYKRYYGMVSFGIGTVVSSAGKMKIKYNDKTESVKDTDKKYFCDVWVELNYEVDKKKSAKFNLPQRKALFAEYIENFSDGKKECKYCGIEPVVNKDGECINCSEMITLGSNLAKKNRIFFYKNSGGLFDEIRYSFNDEGGSFLSMGTDLDEGFEGIFQSHCKSHVKKDDNGDVLTFEKLAIPNNPDGTEILGVLKADVDNLGAMFAFGFEDEKISKLTFSRVNALSRGMHYFFSYYISKLAEEKGYKLYTVFAGGDDLFIIGQYEDIVNFSLDITNKFEEYTGGNQELTLSAGIAFAKAGTPVWYMTESAENLLRKAKKHNNEQNNGVNSKGNLALFDYVGKWKEFKDGRKDFQLLMKGLSCISTAFYYKILEFADMSIRYKDKKRPTDLMWCPRLSYLIGRMDIKDAQTREYVCKQLYICLEENPQLLKALVSLKLYKVRVGGMNELL
jgi:CRISPR-associated protein Csm1